MVSVATSNMATSMAEYGKKKKIGSHAYSYTSNSNILHQNTIMNWAMIIGLFDLLTGKYGNPNDQYQRLYIYIYLGQPISLYY